MSYEKNYMANNGKEYLIEIDVGIEFGEGVYLQCFEAFPIINGEVSEHSVGGECPDYNEIELYCESWVNNEAMNIEQDHRETMADAYYDAYKEGEYWGN